MPKYAPVAENEFGVRWDDARTARIVVLDGGCEAIQHPDGRGSSRGEEVWSKISKGSEDKGDKASNRGQIAVEGACVPSARKGAQAWVPFAYIRAVDVAADGQPVEWRGKVPAAAPELPARRSRQPVAKTPAPREPAAAAVAAAASAAAAAAAAVPACN